MKFRRKSARCRLADFATCLRVLMGAASALAGMAAFDMQERTAARVGRAVKRRFAVFAPILVGATLRNRLFSALGAIAGISLTGLICGAFLGDSPWVPLIVAPIGASAVLLFAVPSSPLAQPWPIIGGNTLSAMVGIAVAHFIDVPVLAIGAGVSLAIVVMSLTRCLHPPGGAAALTAVLGGKVVAGWGVLFPLLPVGINSCLLVGVGLIFHKIMNHSYPHRPAPQVENVHHTHDLPSQLRGGVNRQDIAVVLERRDESFDIDPDDLEGLIGDVVLQALARNGGDPKCQDIMSRDVISVGQRMSCETARSLLLHHNIRTLPVTDYNDRLVGVVGLRNIISAVGPVEDHMVPAVIAAPDSPAFDIVPRFAGGTTHGVVITEKNGKIVGLVSQTDLLATISCLIGLKTPVIGQTPPHSHMVAAES